MLRLILGRAGTGKTGKIIEEIRQRVEQGQGKSVLLVPEQYSHEAERELLRVCGDSTSLYAEVLSFTRLGYVVAQECGGSARRYTDAGGRALQLALALDRCAGGLSVYGGVRRQPEGIAMLLSALDELRAACVDGDALRAAAERAEGRLGDKLRDLALLRDALCAVEAQGEQDPLSHLDLLAEQVPQSVRLAGGHVYIDGFTDFTAQERRVIRALWLAGDVTVCLSCDDLYEGSEVFSLARRTARSLCGAAGEDGVAVKLLLAPSRRDGTAAGFLEENLFSYTEEVFDAGGAVRLRTAGSAAAECELAAAEVLRLVREEHCRWRDVAVAVRGFDSYRSALESAFARAGVPLYTSARSDVLSKPLPALILGAYAILGGGWSYEDVFAYLKTGLTGISRADCDELENYVLLWELRGGAWSRPEPWRQHPEGFNHPFDQAVEERLARIDALRRAVAAPLLHLAEASRDTDGRGQCRALAAFWEELGLAERLESRAAELRAAGREQLAAETLQLWDKTVEALEQCDRILGDMPLTQGEFARLLRLVFSEYDVGTIPVAVDRVTAGDFDRMRRRNIRHLLVLGASDDRLPALAEGSGVFTPAERETLRELQVEVEDEDDRLYREFSLLYNVLTLPSDTLYLSRSLFSPDGGDTQPSFITERVARLFGVREERGDLTAARACSPRGAFELAAAGNAEAEAWFAGDPGAAERLTRLRRAADLSRGRLGADGVRALYGEKTWLTASRIDAFASCKFQYFLRYGLKAKPRECAGFKAPELGTFLHYVLERVARAAGEAGGFACLSDAQVEALADRAVADYVHGELEDFREKSQRFIYLFRRLTRTVRRVVLDTAQELRRSDFTPLDFELDFSKAENGVPPLALGEDASLRLTGVADRVDGWEHDGKLYLRVIDYKTGKKSFSLTDVWYGMGLQMLLYLFALEKNGGGRYGRQIVPAGVLYVPARDVLLSAAARLSDEEILKEKTRMLRRSGLLLGEEDVLRAMERGDDGCLFLPVKVNRAGEYAGDALATAEQLGRLSSYIETLLTDMAGELRRGSITADPWCQSESESTCLWCSYFDACRFDETVDHPRYKSKLKAPEFWSRLEEGRRR